MGVDVEFAAVTIDNESLIRSLPGVHAIYPPGECSWRSDRPDRWIITTMIRWVGEGYSPGDRGPRVAALIRALWPHCTGLEYGGDNLVDFVEVTDALIREIEEDR